MLSPSSETAERPAPDAAVNDSAAVKAIPVRHPGRWVALLILAVLGAMLVHSVTTNPRFEWDVVGQYLFSERIMSGLRLTLVLTAVSMAVGIVLGTVIAVMRLSKNPILRAVAFGYVWLFRGTPLLVQIIFWAYISALYPRLSLGIPFGPEFVVFDANDVISPLVAAVLALSLHEAAYMAEIVRGGIQSVDHGQTEAAQALGMSPLRITGRIILPQAMRVIIPPTGNEMITMLKMSSLVSVIAVAELLYSAQLIYAVNYKTIPLLITASIWYLVITSVLSLGQHYVERHYARGLTGSAVPGGLSRLWSTRRPARPAEKETTGG
ncbi:MAG: amino acid ABC transporter permease [Mycobacterium sp.]